MKEPINSISMQLKNVNKFVSFPIIPTEERIEHKRPVPSENEFKWGFKFFHIGGIRTK